MKKFNKIADERRKFAGAKRARFGRGRTGKKGSYEQ